MLPKRRFRLVFYTNLFIPLTRVKTQVQRQAGERVVACAVGDLMRIIAFQGHFMHNEKRLPEPGASPVYNFLLVVTIFPKYVSNC